MKKALLTTAILFFGLTLSAQNTNVTKETKTTTVTVNNGERPKKIVKTEKKNEVQELKFKDADSKKLNKDLAPTPVMVNSSTVISTDGTTVAEINRSNFYTMNGNNYQLVTDNLGGYKIASPTDVNYGVLRKTSNNNYIFKSNDKISVAYFNQNGDLVVESYDDNSNGVTVETYSLQKK